MQINLRHYTKRVEHDGTIEQKKSNKTSIWQSFHYPPQKTFSDITAQN